MAHEHDQSEWKEVDGINSYALFMGYLSMAVKGMGFLVGLWTTVVLLGGFVSMLEKKDFWSLTIITLVQTAGVFDVFLNEKLRYAWKSFDGLLVTVAMVFRKEDDDDDSDEYWRALVGILVLLLQALVIAIILLPLALLYLFGLLVSTGLSIWRLIERDYGGGDGGGANLTPALNVLYSLALFQGVLFCYQSASYFAGKPRTRGNKDENRDNKEKEKRQKKKKKNRHKTKTGTEKHPAGAKETNLMTAAQQRTKPQPPSHHHNSRPRTPDNTQPHNHPQPQHQRRKHRAGPPPPTQRTERRRQTLQDTRQKDREVKIKTKRTETKRKGESNRDRKQKGRQKRTSVRDTKNTTTKKQQHSHRHPTEHDKERKAMGPGGLHKSPAAEKQNCNAIGRNHQPGKNDMAPRTTEQLHNRKQDARADIVTTPTQKRSPIVTHQTKDGHKPS
uniref:Uncharacterized protein n=1 Tax=Oryza punctata TaxID=4537 RepID=A0A0E0MND0_ORYPU